MVEQCIACGGAVDKTVDEDCGIGWCCQDCSDEDFANSAAVKKLCAQYCPICERDIVPDNILEVFSGEHEGFLFVHEDIEHSDEDIKALESGIN